MFEHYIVFTPHEGREADLLTALEQFGAGVSGDLPCLLELTWGANVNESGLQRGFTHGCFARLRDERSFQAEYWGHPAHQQLLTRLDELCEERFALDYVAVQVVTGAGEPQDV